MWQSTQDNGPKGHAVKIKQLKLKLSYECWDTFSTAWRGLQWMKWGHKSYLYCVSSGMFFDGKHWPNKNTKLFQSKSDIILRNIIQNVCSFKVVWKFRIGKVQSSVCLSITSDSPSAPFSSKLMLSWKNMQILLFFLSISFN